MKTVFLFLFTLFLISLSNLSAQNAKLIGKWSGKDYSGKPGLMIYDKNGYVSFLTNGELVGGKKYVADGIEYSMMYEANDKVTPHTMDFIIKTKKDNFEVMRLLGIYKFVNAKTIVFNMKVDGSERPDTFDPNSDDQLTLTKIK